MSFHFWTFRCDDVDDAAISCKEGEELESKLCCVDLFIEVFDVQGIIRGRGHGRTGHTLDRTRDCIFFIFLFFHTDNDWCAPLTEKIL